MQKSVTHFSQCPSAPRHATQANLSTPEPNSELSAVPTALPPSTRSPERRNRSDEGAHGTQLSTHRAESQQYPLRLWRAIEPAQG